MSMSNNHEALVELRQSQLVPTINTVPRITYCAPKPHIKCECGALHGMQHSIGCANEVCPVCHMTLRGCGCNHD